mmetsp:Transcript_105274/g.336799  ORF Transcript_105274/g.336799 Transcript_105274/m.336799 type:complete len:335 (+) Transcript_105274:1384-2388(+)
MVASTPMAAVCDIMDRMDRTLLIDIGPGIGLNLTGDQGEMLGDILDKCLVTQDRTSNANIMDFVFSRKPDGTDQGDHPRHDGHDDQCSYQYGLRLFEQRKHYGPRVLAQAGRDQGDHPRHDGHDDQCSYQYGLRLFEQSPWQRHHADDGQQHGHPCVQEPPRQEPGQRLRAARCGQDQRRYSLQRDDVRYGPPGRCRGVHGLRRYHPRRHRVAGRRLLGHPGHQRLRGKAREQGLSVGAQLNGPALPEEGRLHQSGGLGLPERKQLHRAQGAGGGQQQVCLPEVFECRQGHYLRPVPDVLEQRDDDVEQRLHLQGQFGQKDHVHHEHHLYHAGV